MKTRVVSLPLKEEVIKDIDFLRKAFGLDSRHALINAVIPFITNEFRIKGLRIDIKDPIIVKNS